MAALPGGDRLTALLFRDGHGRGVRRAVAGGDVAHPAVGRLPSYVHALSLADEHLVGHRDLLPGRALGLGSDRHFDDQFRAGLQRDPAVEDHPVLDGEGLAVGPRRARVPSRAFDGRRSGVVGRAVQAVGHEQPGVGNRHEAPVLHVHGVDAVLAGGGGLLVLPYHGEDRCLGGIQRHGVGRPVGGRIGVGDSGGRGDGRRPSRRIHAREDARDPDGRELARSDARDRPAHPPA